MKMAFLATITSVGDASLRTDTRLSDEEPPESYSERLTQRPVCLSVSHRSTADNCHVSHCDHLCAICLSALLCFHLQLRPQIRSATTWTIVNSTGLHQVNFHHSSSQLHRLIVFLHTLLFCCALFLLSK